jgi:hypothetical protein
MKISSIWRFLVVLSACAEVSYCSPIDRMVDFISQDGAMHNITAPQIIKHQGAGHMTGGSMIVRGPRPKVLQPLHIQAPRFKFDPCTGSMDFFAGGMSFISAGEVMEFFKNTAKSSGMFAAKMMVQTVCSPCEGIITNLEDIARSVNQFSFDQCQLAQSIVDSSFTRKNNAQQSKCLMRAGNNATDLPQSTQKCVDDKDSYPENEESKRLLGDEFNVVWHALNKKGGGDRDFFELIMSASGTLIVTKKDGAFTYKHLQSLFTSRENIEKLVNGSTNTKLKLYGCDAGEKCLNPTEKEVALKSSQAIVNKISNIISTKLVKNVQNDNPNLSDEEQMLISYVSVPLITMIENEIISKGVDHDFLISNADILEVLGYDVVINFLQGLLRIVEKDISSLEKSAMESKEIADFKRDISKVHSAFENHKHTAYQRALVVLQVKDQISIKQKSIHYNIKKIFNKN